MGRREPSRALKGGCGVPRDDRNPLKGRAAVEGILGGLGDILGKIAELAERAETIQKSGGFTTKDGREGRYQVGFNIRTLSGGATGEPTIDVQPFGDVKRDERTGEAEVAETREPPVDVFEEAECVLVVVEMPGIAEGAARFEVEGDVLTVRAEEGRKRYACEVLLPGAFDAGAMTVSAKNGVFEVRFARSGRGAA